MDFNESVIEISREPIDPANAKEIADAIAEALDAKKAKDIKVLYVEDKTVIAEYFVICTGNSNTQVKALAGEVEYRLGLRGVEPYNVEGRDNGTWLVLDYSNVIVHIFGREAREFYNLDKLYTDFE
jgi:ribosome-associated protein